MESITSVELNYLVYRYLQESGINFMKLLTVRHHSSTSSDAKHRKEVPLCEITSGSSVFNPHYSGNGGRSSCGEGFTHAAFTFGFESGLSKSSIDGNLVPPGSLVKFVQKGLQFVEMEANVTNAEIDEDEDFTYLQPLDLITKDANELYKIVKNKRNMQQEAREKKLDEATVGTAVRVNENEGKDKTKKASVL